MIVIGSGLTGNIVAALNPAATVFDNNPGLVVNHKAVLRFRTNNIAAALGMEFKRVKVYKTIWADGKEQQLQPRWMNMYSKKVTGHYLPRSINDLEPVERFVAPSNFHEILANDFCKGRIKYGMELKKLDNEFLYFGDDFEGCRRRTAPVVSTIPLNLMCEIVGMIPPYLQYASVKVKRFKLNGARNIYQTIYFPNHALAIYRVSVTDDDVIAEFIGEWGSLDYCALCDALGIINYSELTVVDNDHEQKYGKIVPIDDRQRKSIIHEMTTRHDIYSIGRFAIWKNILLDDVYDDILKVKKLMYADEYTKRLEAI